MQGFVDDGVHTFLGIPYAAAPVGELRWRPPQPVAKWTGVRQATEFGADCMQGRFGPPRTSLDQMITWISAWVRQGGATWGKPTGFEVRDGRY